MVVLGFLLVVTVALLVLAVVCLYGIITRGSLDEGEE
jgi:hypothetical protein